MLNRQLLSRGYKQDICMLLIPRIVGVHPSASSLHMDTPHEHFKHANEGNLFCRGLEYLFWILKTVLRIFIVSRDIIQCGLLLVLNAMFSTYHHTYILWCGLEVWCLQLWQSWAQRILHSGKALLSLLVMRRNFFSPRSALSILYHISGMPSFSVPDREVSGSFL